MIRRDRIQSMRFFVLLALLALVACRPPEPSGPAATSTTTSPTSTEAREVSLELPEGPRLGQTPVVVTVEEAGQAVTGASVQVTGDMTHAGMVPVIRETVETEAGQYLAEDFEFTMAGDWILTADVRYPDDSLGVGELRVTVPAN